MAELEAVLTPEVDLFELNLELDRSEGEHVSGRGEPKVRRIKKVLDKPRSKGEDGDEGNQV